MLSIDEEKFQKNSEILKKYMFEEIKGVLKNTGKFILEEMPHFEAGYRLLVGPEEEDRSHAQIELIISCAKQYLEISNLDEIIDANLNAYVKNDNLGYNMRKRHKKSQEAINLIREMSL